MLFPDKFYSAINFNWTVESIDLGKTEILITLDSSHRQYFVFLVYSYHMCLVKFSLKFHIFMFCKCYVSSTLISDCSSKYLYNFYILILYPTTILNLILSDFLYISCCPLQWEDSLLYWWNHQFCTEKEVVKANIHILFLGSQNSVFHH